MTFRVVGRGGGLREGHVRAERPGQGAGRGHAPASGARCRRALSPSWGTRDPGPSMAVVGAPPRPRVRGRSIFGRRAHLSRSRSPLRSGEPRGDGESGIVAIAATAASAQGGSVGRARAAPAPDHSRPIRHARCSPDRAEADLSRGALLLYSQVSRLGSAASAFCLLPSARCKHGRTRLVSGTACDPSACGPALQAGGAGRAPSCLVGNRGIAGGRCGGARP
jgi:hypothetical protein